MRGESHSVRRRTAQFGLPPHLAATYWHPGYVRPQTDYLRTPSYTTTTAPCQPDRAHHHGHTQPWEFVWCACHITTSLPYRLEPHWRTVAKCEPTQGQKAQHGIEMPSARPMPVQTTRQKVDRPNARWMNPCYQHYIFIVYWNLHIPRLASFFLGAGTGFLALFVYWYVPNWYHHKITYLSWLPHVFSMDTVLWCNVPNFR